MYASIGLGVAVGSGVFGGPSINELSDAQNLVRPILIQPADGAFAIWGLIYGGLLVWATAQAFSARIAFATAPARWALAAIALANFVWFLAVPRGPAFGLVALLGLLASSWWAVLKLRGAQVANWLRLGPSVLAGWMTVATVVSTAYVLRDAGFSGWGLSDVSWALAMTSVTAVLALALRFSVGNLFFGATVLWAFSGIALHPTHPQAVKVTALALAAVVALVEGIRAVQTRATTA
jgi:hypothetical protein